MPPQDEPSLTELVENLLQHTESLMKGSKNHVVAYSGGVDSSLVLSLLREVNDKRQDGVVKAVLGISPAVSQEQIHLAREVASHLDANLVEVKTKEGSDNVYVANAGQACFACKTHLYSTLQAILDHHRDHESGYLYNGTNADDKQDPTRLGLIAASNFSVRSPLQFTSKKNVRRAAKHLGLPNWNAAASPCLRSRLALGVQATQHHLHMIEKAERIVRQSLLLDGTTNMRVRMLTNQRARVELDAFFLKRATHHQPQWTLPFQELGFSSVEVSPFQSGSVATPTNKKL